MKNFIYTILIYLNSFFVVLLIFSYLSVYINPADFWLIAFFGLSYPLLLIINILFCIFWIYRKNKVFLISLISILIGWNIISSHIQIPLSKKGRARSLQKIEHKNENLKILSYNVRLFNRYNWSDNNSTLDDIIKFIQKEDPDILCLQEFFTNENSDLSLKRICNSLKELTYLHIHYTFKSEQNSNFGIATFSKFPIIQKGMIRFENTANITTYSDILYKNDTIRVYNNHLQSIKLNKNNYDFFARLSLRNEEQLEEFKDISSRLKTAFIKRAKQVDFVSNHIKQSHYPTIICGDFNDTPVSYTFRKMKGKMNDAFIESGIGFGNTYIGKLPSFRIDYIFYSNDFISYNFRKKLVKYSDHFPITCYLKFSE